ncbi:MAG: stage V sporulation protein AC [Clostridia bacterium]|nr:stage V sporulation protein AC [Clostridia bacterium]
MKITKQEYQSIAKKRAPKSPLIKDCLCAFLVGGLLCAAGEVVILLVGNAGLDAKSARLVGSLTLIFLSVLLTGLNVYDNIAKHAGAGTLVPITGFANSMASPAMEFKSEGFVLGVGAKMFSIAGPVIVYGTVASVVYGVIYWITTLF